MQISDLVSNGLLQVNQELVWVRKSLRQNHPATINSNGHIRTADGKTHKSPSGAAKHLNNERPVNGWTAWKVKGTDKSLSFYRNVAKG